MGAQARTEVRTNYIDVTPPHDIEAEQNVLACCLISAGAIALVYDLLSEDDFHLIGHRLIFASMVRLWMAGSGVDYLTVRADLTAQGVEPEAINVDHGWGYLIDLSCSTPTTAHVEYYAQVLADLARQRALIVAGSRIMQLGFEPQQVEGDPVGAALGLVLEVQAGRRGETQVNAPTVGVQVLEAMNEAAQRGDKPDPKVITAPWSEVNDALTMRSPNVVIIAGRPSMGKTSLVMNVAEHVARQGQVVLVFSQEMSKEQLVARMVAGITGIDTKRQASGNLTEQEWDAVGAAVQGLPPTLIIDDRSSLKVGQILAGAKRLEAQGMPPALIVIDYIQLMVGDDSREKNRNAELTRISSGIKRVAKEMRCVVAALSQMSRAVEGREEKRPKLSDLRDCGSLEQDADVVAFVHRPDYYKPDDRKGEADLIIAKYRDGAIADVTLAFDKAKTKFSSIGGGWLKWGMR